MDFMCLYYMASLPTKNHFEQQRRMQFGRLRPVTMPD